MRKLRYGILVTLAVVVLAGASCAPAVAPSPTAAPSRPAVTTPQAASPVQTATTSAKPTEAPAAKSAPPASKPAASPAAAPTPQAAVVQILTGPNAGKELELVKNLTTLGKPGVQVAVLTRRPHGYFITHVEGASHPMVNGATLGDQPHQLNDHDVIELAGVKMEFYFKE